MNGCVRNRGRRFAAAVACATAACLSTFVGCTAYRIGTPSLYSCDVRTVYVPIFESNSFRRGLGERLTEAVQKEIERRTPYKVVANSEADSILTGRIVNERKLVSVEAPTDEPRELQYYFTVELTWTDRNGAILQNMQPVPVPMALVTAYNDNAFYPEVGQSMATVQQESIQQMARQIVGLMETPW